MKRICGRPVAIRRGGAPAPASARTSRGHAGRSLTAGIGTRVAIIALRAAVLVRLVGPMFPLQYVTLLGISGAAAMRAFTLFCLAHGRMLVTAQPG